VGCVSKCNTPEPCLEVPCNITVVENPTTTTTTTINLSECTTFVTINNEIGYYNFDTNDVTTLYTEGFGAWTDIANTQNKLWLCDLSRFLEYDITFIPWSISFNRTITSTQWNGTGLVAIDNTNLIGSFYNKLINIDISGSVAIYTDLVTLPTFGSDIFTVVTGDLLLTSTGKLLCTVNNGVGETRLLQYDYPAMVLEIMVDIYPISTGPYGLTENDGNIYIFNNANTDTLFLVSQTYPYTLIPQVEDFYLQIYGASVYTDCATSNLLTTTTSSSTTTTTTTVAEKFTYYFSNSSTTPEVACSKFVTLYTFYSNDSLLISSSILYTNLELTTRFVGNSNWYKSLSPDEGKVYQIDNFGTIINIITCI
jgi:hypothetical protein